MTNNIKLNSNVANLAEKQTILRKIIESAEKTSAIPIFNPVKIFPVWLKLRAITNIKFSAKAYPFFATALPITAICAIAISPFFPNSPIFAVSLLVYTATLAGAFITRNSFAQAYTRNRLGINNVAIYAFGINNISLMIYDIFQQLRSNNTQGVRISADDLKKLIEINKATHDYSWPNHSNTTTTKSIAGVGVPGISWIIHNWDEISPYLKQIKNMVKQSHTKELELFFYITLIALVILFAFFFGPMRDAGIQKSQKRYLLILTILHQNWA
jgi:hypothetical protein